MYIIGEQRQIFMHYKLPQIALLLTVSFLALIGCSKKDSSGPSVDLPPTSGLLLEVKNSTLRVGEGTKLTGTYYDGDSSIDVSNLLICTTDSGSFHLTAENYAVGDAGGSGEIACTYENQAESVALRIDSTRPISIRLVVGDTTLHTGALGYLQLIGMYEDGTEIDFTAYATWSTNNENVVSINQGVMLAEAAGSAIVLATHASLRDESVSIQVIHAVPTHIEVVQDLSFYIGVERQFKAIGYWDDGDSALLGGPVVWSASNTRAEHQATNGVFKAVAEGPVSISASYEGVTGEQDTYVLASIVVKVTTEPLKENVIVLDQILEITAFAHFSDGTVVDISGQADWHDSAYDPVVRFETIPGSNLASLQAVREDTSTVIWADYDGVSGARNWQLLEVKKTPTN